MSTSTRSPAFTAPSLWAFSSISIGTSRTNFTGGRLCFPRWPFIGCVTRYSFTNSTKPICAAGYPSLVSVLCCVITHGPACKTVAGCTSPLSSNSCVIPTFFPKIPATFAISFSIPAWPVGYWLACVARAALARESRGASLRRTAEGGCPHALLMFFPECLNLHIHSGRKVELHERLHCLRRRIQNVD